MASARNNRRRRRSRGRFGPLFKLLCLLAVIVALTLGATVFFQVETVVVSGNSRYTQEEVVEASGIQIGDNLYRLNKIQISQQLLQTLPYLETVSIRRSLPSTLVIQVTEWQAVARVEAPDSSSLQDLAQSSGETEPADGEGDAAEADTTQVQVADQPWLISVGGKLLETAGTDSGGISVTGLTPIMPREGTLLSVPQAEQSKLDALLSLLARLEELEMLPQVKSIQLQDTQVVMHYMEERFTVKMLLNADFRYKLNALRDSVVETEKKLGEGIRGTFDMTQDEVIVYTPE